MMQIKQMKPRGVRDDIYAAMDDVAEEALPDEAGMEQMGYRPKQPDPNWRDQAARPKSPPGSPYETGRDPALDAFRRKQHLEGPDQDDPFPGVYSDPREAKRVLDGAFYAGQSGDDAQILEIINGPYGNTPFGQLMKRAYADGRRKRGQRK